MPAIEALVHQQSTQPDQRLSALSFTLFNLITSCCLFNRITSNIAYLFTLSAIYASLTFHLHWRVWIASD